MANAPRRRYVRRPDRPVAAVCASGQRAATAASLLERLGAENVIHVVDGGVPAWLREHPDDQGA